MKNLLYIFISLFILTSCEEEIVLELPLTSDKVVVEGYIQPSYPIFLQLTNSSGYFDEMSENEMENVFINDANVSVIRISDGMEKSLVYNSFDDKSSVGIYSDMNMENPFVFDNTFAKVGERYKLEIIYNNDTITSITGIPYIESEAEKMIDSIWFVEDPLFPNYGDFHMSYNDADTLGNNIMLESKRTTYFEDSIPLSEPLFIKSLWGTVRNDFEGFNGVKNFVTYFDRGENSMFGGRGDMHDRKQEARFGNFQTEHIDEETGDTLLADEVLIRISQIERAPFEFWRSTEFQEQTNGNPFAEPMNLQTNVKNGLGVWEGKGAIYYKVIAKKDTTFTERYTPEIFEAF